MVLLVLYFINNNKVILYYEIKGKYMVYYRYNTSELK